MLDKKIINSYPSSCWREATPIGNGVIGGCVYGCIYDERILINHEALYNGYVNKSIPDISNKLGEVRKLMDEKKYSEANDFYVQALKDNNYYANKGEYYPAFDLHTIYGTESAFTNYSRTLDMRTAICTIEYEENGKKATREAFVSEEDRFLVLRLEKDERFEVTLALEMHDLADNLDFYGNTVEYEGNFASTSYGRYIYSTCDTKKGVKYCGIVKILETDGKIICNGHDKKLNIDMLGTENLSNYIKITDATYATVIIDVENGILAKEQLQEKVDALKYTYQELKQRQEKAFSKLFDTVKLDICGNVKNETNEQLLLNSYNGNVDLRLIEKMADYGRYLLIASSYNCKLPANLQGVWNGDYKPAWACTFFNNENIEMEYWQAFAGGLSKTALPLFDLYDSLKDDYRENAKKLFGCRGILLPLFMDNQSGKKDNLQPHVLYWTGSSAWISAIYFDYYQYTQDEDFLKNRAYPFMKEACLFYQDFLVKDENGKLKSYPANSPENRADGDFEGAKEVSVCINPTMDFALVKELLTNLIFVSNKLGIDEKDREVWTQMLCDIPEYKINKDGAINEWLHDDFKDNYHHRHQSHIYPLFPGYEITKENNEKMFKAIEIAVQKRLCIGLKEQTGWSFAHMGNIFARLGDGEKVKECLDNIIRFCTGENLFTYHNDWRNMGVTLKFLMFRKAPFQIDANMGFTATVYEALLFSKIGEIKLLPALPKEMAEGSIKGICARGGFVLDIVWDKKTCKAKIYSEKGGKTFVKAIGYQKNKKQNADGYVQVELGAKESVELIFKK